MIWDPRKAVFWIAGTASEGRRGSPLQKIPSVEENVEKPILPGDGNAIWANDRTEHSEWEFDSVVEARVSLLKATGSGRRFGVFW